jgi:prepilin-type N-terminal cleavage/methylation domain-containing protein
MNRGARIRPMQSSKPYGVSCRGFTLIETMIVLAVTGLLFVVIAASLSGRQNTAEFMQAIQSTQSQIQQTINQVAQGFYPNETNFNCVNGAGTVQITAGSNSQGTNQDCIFLGKVLQFGVQGTNPERYQTFTLAGLRSATASASSPFANASPTVVGVSNNYINYSTARSLKYGLTTLWVHAGANSIGAIGFLMEPGSLNSGSTSGYSSGTQQVDIVPIRSTAIGQTLNQAVASIQDGNSGSGGLGDPLLTTSAPINPSSGVQICLVSGGTNQSGLITIGGTGRQLSVKLDVKSNKTCL